MATVLASLAEDRGASEVYIITGPDGKATSVELAKPDAPARLYAERQPDGRFTVGWRPAT